jgi:16S rRNA (guanine527-N7)-methyltransferase
VETLAENARQILGLQLTPEQLAAFERYKSELIEWNNRFNLTAIRDESGIEIKHFLDSLTCILAFEPGNPPRSLIDVGTGAGFPGIPLKIVYPHMRLTLVESIQKKAGFCQHIANTLGLRQVMVLAERAEEVGQDARQREAMTLPLLALLPPCRPWLSTYCRWFMWAGW